MGIYRTPYERFGQQSYEMWRAARLVIDTGIHRYGWSRQPGDRLSRRPHRAVDARGRDRGRPLHQLARPGAGLQAGRADHPPAARRRPKGNSAPRFDIKKFHRHDPGAGLGAAAGAGSTDRCVHRGEQSLRRRSQLAQLADLQAVLLGARLDRFLAAGHRLADRPSGSSPWPRAGGVSGSRRWSTAGGGARNSSAIFRHHRSLTGWHRALTLLEQCRTWQSRTTSISSTGRATSSAPITGFRR